MTTKKKILSVALAASLAAVAVVGGTLAYFTDSETKINEVSIGNVDIVLDEPQWETTGKDEAEYMYPGEAVAKDPTVRNYGKNPAFVRIKVEWPTDVAFGYRTDYVNDKLGDNWAMGTDGYFYYAKVLAAGESTDALFDQVVLDINTTNGDATPRNINVIAEAIQAQGAAVQWSRVETMTAKEIEDWFNTKVQIAKGA